MKIFLLKLLLIFLTTQICVAEEGEEQLTPVTAIGDVFQITRGDMFDGTRRRISRFVNNLTNNGNRAQDVLRQLSDTTTQARNDFGLKSANITNGIWTAIQNVINGFLETAAVLPEALWTCVDNQIGRAGDIVNRTLTEGFGCLSNAIDSVVQLVATGTNVVSTAINLGTNITSEVVNCGVSNILNFAQVGICLNRIIQTYQTPVNNLIGQLVGLIASALTNIVSVPVGVGVCITATAASAALESGALIGDLTACKINIIGEIIGQG